MIWLTGLSGSGKSTIASALEARFKGLKLPVEVIDGDQFRKYFGQELGYSREDRDINVNRMGYLAKILACHGVTVVVAAITPYRDTRECWKKEIDKFIEVYVHCPLDVCIQRDVKGLYAKALSGEIASFTGISDPYEEPLNPDVRVDSFRQTTEQCVENIFKAVHSRGYLHKIIPDRLG